MLIFCICGQVHITEISRILVAWWFLFVHPVQKVKMDFGFYVIAQPRSDVFVFSLYSWHEEGKDSISVVTTDGHSTIQVKTATRPSYATSVKEPAALIPGLVHFLQSLESSSRRAAVGRWEKGPQGYE